VNRRVVIARRAKPDAAIQLIVILSVAKNLMRSFTSFRMTDGLLRCARNDE
jgi:hypothetical protein